MVTWWSWAMGHAMGRLSATHFSYDYYKVIYATSEKGDGGHGIGENRAANYTATTTARTATAQTTAKGDSDSA